MILISHRGNYDGIDKSTENTIPQILKVIGLGYDCEIDVRLIDGELWLGHDGPETKIDLAFLLNYKEKLWIHCKDILSLRLMLVSKLRCFWHQTDDYTIISTGEIWCYPGKYSGGGIAVLPELHDGNLTGAIGICSDYIKRYS